MILPAAVLIVLFCSIHSFTIQASFEKSEEHSGNTIEDEEFSVSTLLEKANINVGIAFYFSNYQQHQTKVRLDSFMQCITGTEQIEMVLAESPVNLQFPERFCAQWQTKVHSENRVYRGKNLNEPLVLFGDIAVPTGLQNADPCTARGCLWPKATDGNVYVPYRISAQYSQQEKDTIISALNSFARSTCIRFTPLNGQRDFVNIESRSGCFSFVGRRGSGQTVSLSRRGCIFRQTIQHELLHALGFNHEQTRSDRDQHVRIILGNVIRGTEHNFRKIQTRNLGTPYDYNSVMHYGRYAFSSNRQPTIVPIPNSNVAIGRATQMSPTDILRVNLLYRCNPPPSSSDLEPMQRSQFLSKEKKSTENYVF